MTKFIVKQIPADVQVSDFDGACFDRGAIFENCVIFGNRDFSQYGCLIEEIEKWNNNIDDIYDAVSEEDLPFLKAMFANGARTLNTYQKALDSEQTVDILEAVTGKKYNKWCLHGCVQAEWQYLYTPDDETWDIKKVNDMEERYFNAGDEWQIEVSPELIGQDETSTPEVIDFYTTGYCRNDKLKKIAAETLCNYGVDPILAKADNILVQEFVGFKQVPMYQSEDTVLLSEAEKKQEFVKKLGSLFSEYGISQVQKLQFVNRNNRELVEVTDGDSVYNVAVDGDSNFAIAYDVINAIWNH